jgi:hypothetical protein
MSAYFFFCKDEGGRPTAINVDHISKVSLIDDGAAVLMMNGERFRIPKNDYEHLSGILRSFRDPKSLKRSERHDNRRRQISRTA